jgi:hypothetical protein
MPATVQAFLHGAFLPRGGNVSYISIVEHTLYRQGVVKSGFVAEKAQWPQLTETA